MTDRYTRAVLTIIAAALVVIALRGLGSPESTARAADTVECHFSGPVEISRINGKVELEQAYGQPGSSSSYPVYVKTVQ